MVSIKSSVTSFSSSGQCIVARRPDSRQNHLQLATENYAMLRRMRGRVSVASLLLIVGLSVLPLNARVIRVDIASRTDVRSGKVFGHAGAYERITGCVSFSLPVANARPEQYGAFSRRNKVSKRQSPTKSRR
jgi:hypothetical protein